MSTIGTFGLPPIDPSLGPASVRNGPPAAKRAYQVALGFEQLLAGELAQELAATVSSSPAGDGSGADTGSPGLLGSDPASTAYAQLIPDALASSIMSSGGLGIAQQLAAAIDPSIGVKR